MHHSCLRQIAFACILLLASALFASAKPGDQPSQDGIAIRIKNNSLWPRHVKLISYEPGTSGHGVQTFFLLPGASKNLRFKPGTRLYLANQKDINTVMSGQSLRTASWHVVAEIDAHTPLLLFK